MGANNKPEQTANPNSKSVAQAKPKEKTQPKPQKQASLILQSKEPQQFSIPQNLQNRQHVRECVNKYNDRVEVQMKKQYVLDFFAMRQKLLKNMENICKADYSFAKQNKKPMPSKQFKECMQSVQGLISEEDNRMQEEFGVKLFLLADKCLIKEERAQEKEKHKISPVERCVEKLLKYRNLNMEMHILRLEMAREML